MNLNNRLELIAKHLPKKQKPNPFSDMTDEQLRAIATPELLEAIKQDPTQQSFYNELMHTIKVIDQREV
jgi:hypothetical protein